jgi:hypothetical protein
MTGRISNEPAEALVAVHYDPPHGEAILVSTDGDGRDGNAIWIPRSQLKSFHLTGKSTRGFDRDGTPKTFPMANITVPEWLAVKKGLV